jgi:hypothetical protein
MQIDLVACIWMTACLDGSCMQRRLEYSVKISLVFLYVFVIMNGIFPDVETVIVFNDYSSTV